MRKHQKVAALSEHQSKTSAKERASKNEKSAKTKSIAKDQKSE